MNRICPECNSTTKLENGVLICASQQCLWCETHPLNFQNDVIQFQGESGQLNRYTSFFHHCYDNGGNSIGKESTFDSNFKRAKKMVDNCCYVLKLSQNITDFAETKCYKILKLVLELKQDQKDPKEDKKQKHKNFYSVRNIAIYSVYSACFEKGNYYEEFNLCRYANINLTAWKEVVRELNNFLKGKIDFVPIIYPKHLISRVCRKRNLRQAQQNAMIQMCEKIYKCGEFDIRSNTIAAIAFWKVCENSKHYCNEINLNDCCRNHEKMIEEGVKQGEIWKYFDVTAENVRKVFKEFIANRFEEFLPDWNGRIQHIRRDT